MNEVAIGAGGRLARRLGEFLSGLHLPSEGGHFDHLSSELDVREPEAAADDPAVAKEFLDLIGMSRSADVEILRLAAEQQVTHTTADEIGGEIRLPQSIEDFEG